MSRAVRQDPPHDGGTTLVEIISPTWRNMSVKGVQETLGHASAAMTLDLYGHLWADELDAVASRIDEAARAATVRCNSFDRAAVGDNSRPGDGLTVVDLSDHRRRRTADVRRDRDSNPGCLRTTVFKTAPFGRSGIPPRDEGNARLLPSSAPPGDRAFVLEV
jgi:hypothetical protein